MRKILDRFVRPMGLRVVKAHHLEMVYQHDYSGGYEQYRDTQIHHNKRKLDQIWADNTTLARIADDIQKRGLRGTGICHGARNGYEVAYFNDTLAGPVIGTDISDTAAELPDMVVWDFHEENSEWVGKFDFVYSNSLDQAMDPQRAVANWTGQVRAEGRVYIEHTMLHSPTGASEMDPFGAHPFAMPYLFFRWGKGQYRLEDILDVEAKENNGQRAWIFVLAPEASSVE